MQLRLSLIMSQMTSGFINCLSSVFYSLIIGSKGSFLLVVFRHIMLILDSVLLFLGMPDIHAYIHIFYEYLSGYFYQNC